MHGLFRFLGALAIAGVTMSTSTLRRSPTGDHTGELPKAPGTTCLGVSSSAQVPEGPSGLGPAAASSFRPLLPLLCVLPGVPPLPSLQETLPTLHPRPRQGNSRLSSPWGQEARGTGQAGSPRSLA